MIEHKSGFFSALFLVAGTCIGGGMLALPIVNGLSGFWPSLCVMLVCCVMMTASALLLLEASMWMEEGAHFITMASRLIGPFGKAISWVLYLFICYASLVAYAAGGGVQVASVLEFIFSYSISKSVGSLCFILLFGSAVYVGGWFVGRINAILFTGMLGAYVALIFFGMGKIDFELLSFRHWPHVWVAFPITLTAFSFHTMVPSLSPLLKKNAKVLRAAVVGGAFLAFLVYALWQVLVLGIVPVEGEMGLVSAWGRGDLPITQFLRDHIDARYLGFAAEYFAFFAIITSFLGIAFGLFDFLSDGLRIEKKGFGKVFLAFLIVVPVFFFSTYLEKAFLLALDVSGGVGDSILAGMIPVLMVWFGRYQCRYPVVSRFLTGKVALVAIFLFFTFTLFVELSLRLGAFALTF